LTATAVGTEKKNKTKSACENVGGDVHLGSQASTNLLFSSAAKRTAGDENDKITWQ
jgi:hypothetical protein